MIYLMRKDELFPTLRLQPGASKNSFASISSPRTSLWALGLGCLFNRPTTDRQARPRATHRTTEKWNNANVWFRPAGSAHHSKGIQQHQQSVLQFQCQHGDNFNPRAPTKAWVVSSPSSAPKPRRCFCRRGCRAQCAGGTHAGLRNICTPVEYHGRFSFFLGNILRHSDGLPLPPSVFVAENVRPLCLNWGQTVR